MPHDPSVILVDEHDNVLGEAGKWHAHKANLLHRAFSVLLLDQDNPNLCLLQQRQSKKYHCGDLWSNTCCSHPLPGETIEHAAGRRLREELGIETSLEHLGHFIYQASFENDLHEHELDHVFVGLIKQDDPMSMNLEEVKAVQWPSLDKAYAISKTNQATPWLQPVLDIVLGSSWIKRI